MNPIAFTVGPFEVRWYSICILSAALFGLLLMEKEAKRLHISTDTIFNMMFWAFIFGILGARIYYVLFNLDIYSQNPKEIFMIWNGGLAIHGGIIAGLLVFIVYCWKNKLRLARMTDIVAPVLLLCQTIGRWGNFFNQEAHGAATTVEALQKLLVPGFIINGMTIDGVTYFPSFYFEAIACLIAFLIIIIVRRFKYVKVGQPTAMYLMAYGGIRFFIEMGRTDALLIGGFKMAQIVSIIFFLSGLGILIYTLTKSKFDDLYNDLSNVDIKK